MADDETRLMDIKELLQGLRSGDIGSELVLEEVGVDEYRVSDFYDSIRKRG